MNFSTPFIIIMLIILYYVWQNSNVTQAVPENPLIYTEPKLSPETQARVESVLESIKTIDIEDIDLYKCIGDLPVRRVKWGQLVIDDIRELEELVCRDKKIYSLKGISSLVNLKKLDLKNNNIKEADELLRLRLLRELNLEDNNLVSIRSFDRFKSLEKLYIAGNKTIQHELEFLNKYPGSRPAYHLPEYE